jgi:hypothetical protein
MVPLSPMAHHPMVARIFVYLARCWIQKVLDVPGIQKAFSKHKCRGVNE